jgi:hypothetical protein
VKKTLLRSTQVTQTLRTHHQCGIYITKKEGRKIKGETEAKKGKRRKG